MSHRVRIHHPGYHAQNTLFTLPARDGTDHDHAHYPTVLEACSIITNNTTSDVWLSPNTGGNPRQEATARHLLPAGDYFLHVHPSGGEPDSAPYPIVPNFRTWKYPHDTFPPLWQDAACWVSSQSPNRDLDLAISEECRITANRLACEDAHILSSSEKRWFTSNDMDLYGQLSGRSGDTVADTWVNKMRLQAQAHRLWDNLQFCIVPRRSIDTDKVTWYTQMMNEDDELERDWHNREVQPLRGRAWQYLHARYAYGIFPRLHTFLQGGQPRRLLVHSQDGTSTREWYGVAECRDFTLNQGRGRSASPLKRARGAAEEATDSLLAACRHHKDSTYARCVDVVGSGQSSATSESEDSAIGGVPSRRHNKRKSYTRSELYPQEWDADVSHDEYEHERGRKRFRI